VLRRTMAWNGRRSRGSLRQVILFLLCVCVLQSGAESLRYSVAEEMERESFVGNIAQDLGLDPSQLAARKARVVSEGSQQLFRLNPSTGVLTATETLDREEICPQSETCTLFFKVLFDNPLQLIRGEVEVLDVNDNSPVFPEKEMVLDIPETTPPGFRFLMESAWDKDVGSNGLQNYSLGSNSYFSLALGTGKDGIKYPELVLDRHLDREEQPKISLLLTATDGGSPPRSGTTLIGIVVLDANDNMPVFSQEVYEVHIAENSPPGHLVVRVTATDPDDGSYGKVQYTFSRTLEGSQHVFELNPDTGEIRLTGRLDFEETKKHEMVVKATDGGGLFTQCKVLVEVVDVNDNAPEIQLTSHTASIPEDAPPRTLVALFSVRDRDSGDNGRTECTIEGDLPFTLTPTFDNYYELRTNAALDRETTSEYNISIRATDWGPRRLSSRQSLWVQVWDVNDNAPAFSQELYSMWVTENNSPMVRIGSVQASDADAGSNARVQYALERQEGQEQPALSVSSESGDVYVVRSLDYERLRALEVWLILHLTATDGGSPPRSGTAQIRIVVLDANDNTPMFSQKVYEVRLAENSPPGQLVVRVAATDPDEGSYAKVQYAFTQASEESQQLFDLNPDTGEIRLTGKLDFEETEKHIMIVRATDGGDRGQPPRSASATLAIALLHDFSDAHLRLSHEAPPAEPDDTLTLYLIACLACVSALCLATGLAALLMKLRRDRQRNAEPLPTFPTAVAESDAGSLPRSLVYDVCLTAGTLSSDFHFLGPLLPCFSAGMPPNTALQRSSMCSQEASNLGEGGD
ncbi:PCDBG protein, partial [Indicator maculatus]|nr:PCDBG protein [Indicator maculatus]